MFISQRLKTLVDCLSEKTIVADIGSDHAYLCVLYMSNKQGIKAYACDINENALKQAKQTLYQYSMLNVEMKKMDGITDLPSDVKEVVIAGMGYDTIVHILSNREKQLKNVEKLVIQCNKNVDKLKEFLHTIGFYPCAIHIVHENEIYYEVLVCGKEQQTTTIQNKELYLEYLKDQMRKIENIENYIAVDTLQKKYETLQKQYQKILETN